jgi:hypothetical protein
MARGKRVMGSVADESIVAGRGSPPPTAFRVEWQSQRDPQHGDTDSGEHP